MIRISLIGTGNVAWHFAQAFANSAQIDLVEIAGRSKNSLLGFKKFASCTTEFKFLQKTDIIIVAVTDSAIPHIAEVLSGQDTLVVHTSGSVAMKALDNLPNYGVFYPLQTFSKERPVNFENIPFCIEASSRDCLKNLQKLVMAISGSVYEVTSQDRASLHLAAVLANNFTNHLLTLTKKFCDDKNVDFDLLKPLITETVEKAFILGPENAQTGPARRGDYSTLKKQLSVLEDSQLQNIYKILTNSILNSYGKEEL